MNAYYSYNMRRSGLAERAAIAREAREYWTMRQALRALRQDFGWRNAA